jgi:hypothetical protein
MRPGTAALALGVVIVAAIPPADAYGVAVPLERCPPARTAQLVKASGQARVFRRVLDRVELQYYACVGQRRPVSLGDVCAPEDCELDRFAIAGSWVAWAERFDGGSEGWAVQSCDLLTRRGISYGEDRYDAINPRVRSVGVTKFGAVAWLTFDPFYAEVTKQLFVFDGAGSRELAARPDIDSRSFALRGSVVSWRDRAGRHSYLLRGSSAERTRGCGRLYGSRRDLRRRCKRRGARILFRDENAMVYRLRGRAYGCLFETGRSVPLDSPRFREGRDREILDRVYDRSGPYAVARVTVQDENGYENWLLVRYDLRHPHTEHVFDGTCYGCGDPDAPMAFYNAVVRPNGAVAWIADRPRFGDRVLLAQTSQHKRYQLDAGFIIAHSLTLEGSTLSWRNGYTWHDVRLR